MPTRCLDIKEDKRFSTTSPIAIGVWLALFLVINVVMPLGFMYFIVNIFVFILVHLFFQFEARLIFLSLKFLKVHSVLTPNFEDKTYLQDETRFAQIARSTHPRSLKEKRLKFEQAEKALVAYQKKLAALEKGKK